MSVTIPSYSAYPIVIPAVSTVELANLPVGHVNGVNLTPMFVPGAGSGTTPTVEIVGTDLAGTIKITPSADAIGGMLGRLTFVSPYPGGAPVVIVGISSQAGANVQAIPQTVFADGVDQAGFDLSMWPIGTNLFAEGSGTFLWSYHVLGKPV